MRKGLYRVLVAGGLSVIGLFLSGCQTGRINTAVTLSEDIEMEIDSESSDKVSSYFERESYTSEEMDEMFYVVENHSDERIEVSEFYFVQKWVEDEWKSLDNNALDQIDRTVAVSPGESAEFVFWLSAGSDEFDEGTYRLSTRMTVIEETEENRDGETRDLYIPFEINE